MKKPPGPTVRCPKCGRKQEDTGGSDALFYCKPCGGYFDRDGDDGGDYDDDPTKRLEREESRRSNTHQRRRPR